MDEDRFAAAAEQRKRSVMRNAVIASAMLTLSAAVIVPSSAPARDRRDRDELSRPTANQVLDVADARIARFKVDLQLTPDQDKNWGPVQTALHDMAQRRTDRRLKLREQRSAATSEAERRDATEGGKVPDSKDWTTIDEMRVQADTFNARADDLRKIADATGPLYDSLDSSQRRRFRAFVSHYFGEEQENDLRR